MFIAIEVIIGVLTLVVDLVSKAVVEANMVLGESIVLIENVLSLTYVRNTGAAFSILDNQMTLFYIITPLAFIAFTYYLVKNHKESKVQNISIVLILAGILGNFYDRVMFQYVRDFIQVTFINFPVWNVADMALVIGTALFVLYLLVEIIKEQKEIKKKKENE